MNIYEILRHLKLMGKPKITFSIYWDSGVLTVRFNIDAGEPTEYDLLNARGDVKRYKTIKAVLSDLCSIDPGLNQDSQLNFYFMR